MHPKLLYFRYKLFQYRHVEQAVAERHERLLDIGCGDGENMLRFQQSHLAKVGLEVSWSRLRTARQMGLDVMQASGTRLPHGDNSFDMVYIAHVLHHVADYGAALAEIARVLDEQGEVFLVETVTDHPLLRFGRNLYPYWRGDHVEADWSFAELSQILQDAGFEISASGRYNLIFWLWEIFPLTFWPMELFSPFFVYLDILLARWFGRYSVHAYFVLQR